MKLENEKYKFMFAPPCRRCRWYQRLWAWIKNLFRPTTSFVYVIESSDLDTEEGVEAFAIMTSYVQSWDDIYYDPWLDLWQFTFEAPLQNEYFFYYDGEKSWTRIV